MSSFDATAFNTAANAASTSAAAAKASATATTAKESSDRFLKLLVTQLKNQDPLNPVDNAQMTSQMAQISTVTGIEKLNSTVESLNGQFVQMQAVQGAALVGKDVILKGDKLSVRDGVASGMFEIDSAADIVKAEVLSPAGLVVDTLNLGAQSSGRHAFVWPNTGGVGVDAAGNLSQDAGYRFRITANSGAASLTTTALMKDQVSAVNTGGASLTLELARSGKVPYAQIQAVD